VARDGPEAPKRNPGIAIAGAGLGLTGLACVLAYVLGAEGLTPICGGVGALMFLAGVLLSVFAPKEGDALSE
jgi:hypothetical protein